MAEAVHFHLEQLLPELKDLQEKGIFDEHEIREIVQTRTKFEYKLKRRTTEKSDFTSYIRYEKSLEALRASRIQELSISGRHTVSDHSIRQHICSLYNRAVKKFKGDINFWLEYISYARSISAKSTMDRAVATALSLNPNSASLWIAAAEWEFEGKGNANAARNLYQKAIRAVPESHELWLSFFKFELEFSVQLTERRNILNISCRSDVDLTLALIVHRHCLNNLPYCLDVHEKFFEVASSFSTLEKLCSFMLKNIEGHEKSTTCPDVLTALSHFVRGDAIKDEADILADFLSDFSSRFPFIEDTKVLNEAINFLRKLYDSSSANLQTALADKMDQLLQFAQEKCILTESLYLSWIVISKDQQLDYTDIIESATKAFPSSERMKLLKATSQLQAGIDVKSVFDTVKYLSCSDPDFWRMFFELHVTDRTVCEILEESLRVLSSGHLSCFPWKLCVDVVGRVLGPKALDYHKKLLSIKVVPEMLHALIESEESGLAPSLTLLEQLYSMLIETEKVDDMIWLKFINVAHSNGDIALASNVYSRALKKARNPAQLRLDYEASIQE